MREILFVAGEVSGDQHAAAVARALVVRKAPFRLTGVGGDRMRDSGVELMQHAEQLAVMGFVEPFKRLPEFRRLRNALRKRIESGNVALVILVDYGGFNLTIAPIARAAGVPVLYFISPQVWASRAGRMKVMSASVTKAAVILPFEEKLLRENGVNATFVGHPLLDRALDLPDKASARLTLGVSENDPLLVLFPGSRRQEIDHHLEPFVATAQELKRRNPRLQVLVSAAPHVNIPKESCPFPIVSAPSLTLLRAADAALCKSGTTTLEAAVAGCPLIVAYRTDGISFWLAKRVIKIAKIGMVNIVAGADVAPEFVQRDVEPARMADALAPLLDLASPVRQKMLEGLQRVRSQLGEAGSADRVALMALELAHSDEVAE